MLAFWSVYNPWSEHAFSLPFPKMFQQMEKKKQENKMRRDQLNDQYLELLEKQRLYFKTVKEFKEVRGRLGWVCQAKLGFMFTSRRAILWLPAGL